MKMGLLGYGTVGSGVHEVLRDRMEDVQIKKILVRHLDGRPDGLFTTSFEDILDDPEISVVIEALSDPEVALRYILAAFARGKHVVTANKQLVADHLPELLEAAATHGVVFRFEATVGGGLPWLRTLRDAKRLNRIEEVYGNFNGTSNFILELMQKDGIDFADAFCKSRMLRYRDPGETDDVSGLDARNKLAITAMIAFDAAISPKDIPTYGIETIRNLDFGFLERNRLVIKPMSYAMRKGDRMCLFVAPTLYRHDRLRANVGGNHNFLGIRGDVVGKIEMIGQGSGKYATACGILSDVADLQGGYTNGEAAPKFERVGLDETLLSYKFYFSFDRGSHQIERILLPYVFSIFETNHSFILTTRRISLDTCLDLLWKIEETGERFFFAVYQDPELRD